MKEQIREEIEKYGAKAKGRGELLKHLEGKRLTGGEAIRAYCYMCGGFYSDGRDDCRIPHCPLYPRMPYRTKESR